MNFSSQGINDKINYDTLHVLAWATASEPNNWLPSPSWPYDKCIKITVYALTVLYRKFQASFSPFQILPQFHQRGLSLYSANYWNHVTAGTENSTVADRAKSHI